MISTVSKDSFRYEIGFFRDSMSMRSSPASTGCSSFANFVFQLKRSLLANLDQQILLRLLGIVDRQLGIIEEKIG